MGCTYSTTSDGKKVFPKKRHNDVDNTTTASASTLASESEMRPIANVDEIEEKRAVNETKDLFEKLMEVDAQGNIIDTNTTTNNDDLDSDSEHIQIQNPPIDAQGVAEHRRVARKMIQARLALIKARDGAVKDFDLMIPGKGKKISVDMFIDLVTGCWGPPLVAKEVRTIFFVLGCFDCVAPTDTKTCAEPKLPVASFHYWLKDSEPAMSALADYELEYKETVLQQLSELRTQLLPIADKLKEEEEFVNSGMRKKELGDLAKILTGQKLDDTTLENVIIAMNVAASDTKVPEGDELLPILGVDAFDKWLKDDTQVHETLIRTL